MRNPLQLLGRPRSLKPDAESHPPVPYVGRSGTLGTMLRPGDAGPINAMGATATSYAVVDLLANTTAQVEWHLYKSAASGKDEDRVEVTDHPALTLWRKPNPFMVRALFMETVNQHYELVAQGAMVIYKVGSLPVQLWPVRPDRLRPVPHPTKFMTGWTYTSPDGEKVPLGLDEVLMIRTPNPADPYGALGVFGALTTELDSSRFASAWNRNYFVNGAEPGGVIEIPVILSDEDYQIQRTRWQEQHRGVAAAHRVAMLEGGMKWVSNATSHKDMTFVELQKHSDETVMVGKRVNKHMLGITEDVNRATAEAASAIHGQWQLIPRLERWKQLLNERLLPMFGETTGRGFEFDYENPVPEDEERAATVLSQRAAAAKTLVEAGGEWAEVLEACGLPEIAEREKPDPPPAVLPPTPMQPMDPMHPMEPGGDDEEAEVPAARVRATAERLPLPRSEQTGAPDVDLDEVQGAWEQALAALMAVWGGVTTAWQADLVEQIRAAIDAGRTDRLTRLVLDSDEATAILVEHMTDLARIAADRVVSEARRQGAEEPTPTIPKPRVIEDQAAVTAGLLAAGLAISAGREAMRVATPDLSGVEVADKVAEFLAAMSDAGTRSSLGGALTGAQNQARIETFKTGPVAALYANEKLDSNTCGPCRAIDGRYIGTTADATTMAEVQKLYPMGGYVDCLGRDRCRGTITGAWRKGVEDGQG